MRGMAIREQLTNEWEERRVKEDREYAILTAEIAGDARRALEKKSGHKVISKSNFLDTNPLEVELIPEK